MTDYYLEYGEFGAAIDSHGGVYLTTMEELREAHEAGRLGKFVREAIKSELESRGIGTLPEVLPTYQHEEVRLFRLGSPIAAVVSAVLHPSESGDATLQQSVGSDAEKTLRAVKELVCG